MSIDGKTDIEVSTFSVALQPVARVSTFDGTISLNVLAPPGELIE